MADKLHAKGQYSEAYKTAAIFFWQKPAQFFVKLNVTPSNHFFKFNTRSTSRGHRYKLYKERAITGTRTHFFSERVINAWNSLPTELDFTSLNRFRRAIVNVDFSAFTKCFQFIS